MRQTAIFLCTLLFAAMPAAGVEFLGVELCVGSMDTSVVLPVGSPLSLQSAEIGRHGGLLLLLKADNGDIMDHIDNLMDFYTDARGTGDAKKLQWNGRQITAYAQLIKGGYAALAVSTTQTCDEAAAAVAADVGLESAIGEPVVATPPDPEPSAQASQPPVDAVVAAGTATAVTVEADHSDERASTAVAPTETAEESAKTSVIETPETTADFVLKGRLKHTAAEDGWVDVMGVVVNSSGHGYAVASFDLSLYDGAGELICVDTLSVNQLRDGQERAFRSAIRCADYDATAVAGWKLQFAGAH